LTELHKGTDFSRSNWEKETVKTGSSNFHVIGNGPIAQSLCIKLFNLGFKVKAYTRNPSKYNMPYKVVDFDYNEKGKDNRNIIINLLPSNKDTIEFIGSSFLTKFSSIYYYLNIGRPQTESLNDIRKLMRLGIIKFAGWDVIRDKEVCLSLKEEFNQRVDFTPHVAAFTSDHWDLSFELVQKNINSFLLKDYKSMVNQINE
jgi:phosphoglycerate dehydrogenase-like enzyme